MTKQSRFSETRRTDMKKNIKKFALVVIFGMSLALLSGCASDRTITDSVYPGIPTGQTDYVK
ncbi:MAG: hypothetical protein EOM84_01030 [Sphingobacteriia bacterium]|nr:hypothetical protein [Sphingobacteriia bacterium]